MTPDLERQKLHKGLGVSCEILRYWEQAGIVKPIYVKCGTRKYRRYFYEDIKRTLCVRELVDHEKYSLEGAIMKLKTKQVLKFL